MAKGKVLITTHYNGGDGWICSRCHHRNWKWQKNCADCNKRRTGKDQDA